MKSALVVVDSGEAARRVGKRAGEFAAALNANIHVVKFVDRTEYQHHLEHDAANSQNLDSIEEVEANARDQAQAYADEMFDDLDIEVHISGIVENVPDGILSYANTNDCDHIFLTGPKRSPTGKALFGDTAQTVILDFDGPVTVVTA